MFSLVDNCLNSQGKVLYESWGLWASGKPPENNFTTRGAPPLHVAHLYILLFQLMQNYLPLYLRNVYTYVICFKASLSAHASRKSQLLSHFWYLSLIFFPAIQFSINLSQFSKWENEDQIAHNLITHFLLNIYPYYPYYWKLIVIQHYHF